MATGLTITRNYLNPYETAYHISKSANPFMNEDWQAAANDGTLDEYITALDKNKNLDMTKFINDYGLTYTTSEIRRSALYNEAFADREIKKRSVNQYNEYGDVIGTTEVEMSDYEYNKSVILEQNAAVKREYLNKMAQEYKDEQSVITKILGNIASVGTSFVRGIFSGVNDIIEFTGGLIEGTINSISNGSDWAASVGNVLESDKYRAFQFIEDATIDFEKQYGYRDIVTGEYTTIGAIVGGAFESIGKMLPSSVLTYATGGSSLVSMGTFYTTSEFGQGYEQNYITAKRLAQQGELSDPNYLEIMSMQGVSTVAKVGISLVLTKVMGGTYVKNKSFGLKSTHKGIAEGTSTLAKYLITLGGDALEEGLEEVLQDSIEVLVTDTMYGGDYAKLSDLNATDLAITFLSAAFGGIIGTGFGIATTQKIMIDKDGVATKLNKIDSFLLKSDLSSIIQDFNDAKTFANKIKDADQAYSKNETYNKYRTSAIRAYKALRTISSMFGEIGETRARNIQSALTRITDAAKAGKYNREKVSIQLDSIIKQVASLPTDFAISNIKKLKNDLEQAGITQLAEEIESGEGQINLSENMTKSIEDIKKQNTAKNNYIVAKDGKDIVVADNNTVIIPNEKLESEKSLDIIKQIANKKCKNVIQNLPIFQKAIDLLQKVYIKIYNNNYTDERLLSAFFTNSDFVTECLFADSILTQSFINDINNLIDTNISKISTDTKEVQFAKHYVNTAQTKWKIAIKEYLSIMPSATDQSNLLSPSEQKAIDIKNPIRLFYKAFDRNQGNFDVSKLTDNERTLLSNILDKAKSVNKRLTLIINLSNIKTYSQINDIIEAYRTSNIAENDYLREDTAPNRIFNRWLKYHNLTLSTLFDDSHFTDIEMANMQTLGIDKYGYREYQFENDTNGMYTVDINTLYQINGKTKYSIEVIYHNADADVLKITKDVIKRQHILRKDKQTMLVTDNKFDIVKSLLKSDILNSTEYTIDDIITNPDLLNESIKQQLLRNGIMQQTNIGNIVDERKLILFLRSEIVKSSNGNLSIIQLRDGHYAFAQTIYYKDIIDLKRLSKWINNLDIEKLSDGDILDLSDIINSKFDDLDIVFYCTDLDDSSGQYNKSDNSITISIEELRSAKSNPLILFDTIAHEYIHALQFAAGQSSGFDAFYVTSHFLYVDNGVIKKIPELGYKYEQLLSIFKEYIPDIANKSLFEQAQLMDKILYSMCSGELISFGISDADFDATFIPFIMTHEYIIFSNGRKFEYGRSQSIFESKLLNIPSEQKVKIPTLLELADDPNYHNTMDLYNYLLNVTDFGSPNDTYIDKHIYSDEAWNAKFELALNDFANMKSSQAIGAYTQLGTLGSIDPNVNNELVQNVLATLTPEDRLTSLRLAHIQLAPQMTFEEFLNTDLPFIRIQHTADTYDTDAMSIAIGSFATASFAKSMYEAFKQDIDNYIIIGKIKPSKLICYLEPSHFEAFVKPADIVGASRFRVDLSEDGVIVYDDETKMVTLAGTEDLSYGVLIPSEQKATKDVDEKEYPKKYKPKYKKRNAKQDIETGKVKFEYEYPKRQNRQISKKIAGDTNLQYYVGAQMSPEMQHFVVNATQLNAPDYIDDIRKGILTRSNLLKDFTFGLVENERTFNLINDSFYHNSNVNSLSELNSLISNARDAWATAILLKASNLGDDVLNLGPDVLIQLQETLFKDEKLFKLYNKLQKSYEISYAHFGEVEVDTNYLRILIMKHYDGTLESLRKCVTIARSVAAYNHTATGDLSKTADSTDRSIKGGRKQEEVGTIGDTLSSSAAQDLDDIIDAPRKAKVSALLQRYLHKIQDASTKKGFNADKAFAKYKEYEQKVNNATDEQIDKAYSKLILAELSAEQETIQVEEVSENDLSEIVKRSLKKDKANIVRAMSHQLNTIRRNLSPREKQLFLKDNSDIFDEDLKVKEEALYDKDATGTNIYKDFDILKSLKNRINQLSIDVRSGVYESKKSADYRKQLNKDIAKYKNLLAKQLSKPGKNVAVTIVEQDRSLTIDVNRSIPPKLQELLSYGLTKKADSNIQYLSEKDEKHTVVSLKNFINDNIEILSKLTQDELLDIVDFYLTSAPAFISDGTRYASLQVLILSYIYKSAMDGVYQLDSTRLEQVYNRLKAIVNEAGTTFNTWQTAMKMFKPAEDVVEAMYRKHGVKVKPEQLSELAQAFKDGDPAKLVAVRQKIYTDLIEDNKDEYLKHRSRREQAALQKMLGDENGDIIKPKRSIDSFFAKVWSIERAFMLSSPGTWLRNLISNSIIGGVYVKDKQILPGLNTLAGKIGNFVSKTLPQKWKKEGQYKIIGTKVSSDVASFIKTNYLDNGLISMISDAVTKYDPKRIGKHKSTSDIYAELITDKLAQDVFNKNHKFAAFFSKMLSDDIATRRTAIVYFGKILTENNRDLSKGITDDITSDFVDAYLLAANDYMHKTNFLHKFEEVIRTRFGDTGEFVWKQFFPFASSALNWFAESLNYTPIGLVKSIINFAKLENQIDKIDKAKAHGERVASSKFAQYLAIRNIGKGVIGSIGMLIGGLLALSGMARLDEDDEKYKLKVGNVLVDISEIFGSQGILLGLGIFQGIKDKRNFETIVQQTVNTLFEDSLYTSILNMFRYNGTDTYSNVKAYLTYNLPSMFIPSALKTFASIAKKYDVQYSQGLLGKIEKLAVNSIPFLDRTMTKKIDIYTGEEQIAYNSWFLDVLLSKLGVVKFKTYNISNLEETAILLGVNKSQLTGKYTISDNSVELSASEVNKLNAYYAELNTNELSKLVTNTNKYSVLVDGKYKMLSYSQMTAKEKATVFERIMSNNSSLSKIYILTSTNKYKYYASDSEFTELRKLGIVKNVYRKTNKLQGFVKK